MKINLHEGDCLNILRTLPDNSIDAVITDPPYGLANTDSGHVTETLSRWFAGERDYLPSGKGFMGKAWDAFVPPPAVWDECYRVLKPGGHLLCFAGTRTVDLMGLSVRLAGFDLRDSITWLYGSGFPKSLDVGKAIDKAAGAPATPEAQQWHGWGTACKPASEPIIVARKPLAGTVAANVLAHGTGALNIDACRVATEDVITNHARGALAAVSKGIYGDSTQQETHQTPGQAAGRWPANVVMDGVAADALDEQSGGASRFYPVFRYQAKAPTRERPSYITDDGSKVAHPTVKPLALMRWLIRLVTPPGGTVLDPFAGSGTTIEAALSEGFDAVGIERDPDYLPLIRQRIAHTTEKSTPAAQTHLFEDIA